MINKKYYPLLLGVFILVPIILAYQTFERNLGEGEGAPRTNKGPGERDPGTQTQNNPPPKKAYE